MSNPILRFEIGVVFFSVSKNFFLDCKIKFRINGSLSGIKIQKRFRYFVSQEYCKKVLCQFQHIIEVTGFISIAAYYDDRRSVDLN